MDASVESSGRRSVGFEVNMIPFIDLLFVTIAFLLITAVWTTNAQIPAAATTGSLQGAAKPVPRLHVFLKDEQVRLVWRDAEGVTLSERQVPFDDAALADATTQEWRERGAHRSVSDAALDDAVVHVGDRVPHRDIVRLFDALAAPKREIDAGAGRRMTTPAFSVSLGTL